jgi:V8-like Glu-specific endopeptidase
MKYVFNIGLISALVLNIGCADHVDSEPSSPNSVSEDIGAPKEIVTSKGRRYLRVKKVEHFSANPLEGNRAIQKEVPSNAPSEIERMSEEELAEAIRPVGFMNGYEYILAEPDYELARKIKRGEGGPAYPPHVPEGAVVENERNPIEKPVVPTPAGNGEVLRNIIGAKNTTQFRTNTTYPQRTAIVYAGGNHLGGFPSGGGGCTATLIGASTALSMAHCVWDQSAGTWGSMVTWAAGVDSQDANPTPYGAAYGCYWVNVPQQYKNGSTTREFDFAVFEYTNTGCGTGGSLYPGNTVGWLGWWLASASALEGHTLYGRGYPNEGAEGYTWNWPQIWGHHDTVPDVTSTTWLVAHEADLTYGHSGTGMYQFILDTDDRYVTAIHQGYGTWSGYAGIVNFARRVDSAVYNFVVANSAL